MSENDEPPVLQFSPFNSSIDPSFLHKLSQLKLDVDRLEETVREIWGYYSICDPPRLAATIQVDCSGFNSEFGAPSLALPCRGVLLNKNTIEAFKGCDKQKLLEEQGDQLWQDIASGRALKDPSLLSRFVLLTYADLKKYHFYYWFAFPAPNSDAPLALSARAAPLSATFTVDELRSLSDAYRAVDDWRQKGYFAVRRTDDGITLLALEEVRGEAPDGLYVGFADPCPMAGCPGWPMRNFLALLSSQCPHLVGQSLSIIGLRLERLATGWSCANSDVYRITLPPDVGQARWVGWERNERGKFGPRLSNLSSSMDPIRLAETSVDLNLKLMKWRLLPELDLDVVKGTRCLLLGAGTLGCSVARNLMAWGVGKITLVDSGRVSYSNPVRQSLYTHATCLQGGELKAVAAAKALKEIFPGVEATGVVLSIPMPGHPVGESQLEETTASVAKLEELMANHDAVFLLMDSRESRWLPTLLGASMGKIVMNAALGFDTYLVMRHGVRPSEKDVPSEGASRQSGQPIPGEQLGCYFCNDVTAPGNSQRDRSLDQQCTVTRPGVSGIAAALVVELLVSILQHPLKAAAPADAGGATADASVLGLVPHTVRGFLGRFDQVLPSCHKFPSCVACSQSVLSEYRERGLDFLLQVFDSPHFLEDVTGLTRMKQETELTEIWELSDSDAGDTD